MGFGTAKQNGKSRLKKLGDFAYCMIPNQLEW